MTHGISAYYLERARFTRRLSWITIGVSAGTLALFGLAWKPPLPKSLTNRLARVVRFGYEGPNQYVRRISLQQYEGVGPSTLSDLGNVGSRIEHKGGAQPTSPNQQGRLTPRISVTGIGSSERELTVRSVGHASSVPVVRSDELVIDRLVRPEYPAPLLEKNIEGKVILQALIDTVGRVVDVQIMGSTGETLFENAAAEAVRQCRFRPYRPNGEPPSEVFAVFRFAFRIY